MGKIEKVARFFVEHDVESRETGDNAGVFFYMASWLYVGIALLFVNDASLQEAMQIYIFYDFVAIFFVVIYFWRTRDKKFKFPSLIRVIENVTVTCISLSALLLLGQVLRFYIGDARFPVVGAIPGNVSAGVGLSQIAFHFFRLVPVEEMVFRGAAIEIVLLFSQRYQKHSHSFVLEDTSLGEKAKHNLPFFIGGLSGALLFGVLHLPAVEWAIYPLVYLTILGGLAAFLRFKYGILSAMILHGLNNVISFTIGVMVIL